MAIQIIKESREFTKVEKYLMTLAPENRSVKDLLDGEEIAVDGWLEFIDDEDGKNIPILAVLTDDKTVVACQSSTFKKSLMDIHDVMDGEKYRIRKISGTTKAGREYINCVLVV